MMQLYYTYTVLDGNKQEESTGYGQSKLELNTKLWPDKPIDFYKANSISGLLGLHAEFWGVALQVCVLAPSDGAFTPNSIILPMVP